MFLKNTGNRVQHYAGSHFMDFSLCYCCAVCKLAWDQTSTCPVGTKGPFLNFSQGKSNWVMKLTIRFSLVPRLKMCGSILPLAICVYGLALRAL